MGREVLGSVEGQEGALIVTNTDIDCLLSIEEVAVIFGGLSGTAAGAVYKPPTVIRPESSLPPATPLTVHTTATPGLPTIWAANGIVPPVVTVGSTGVTTTVPTPSTALAFCEGISCARARAVKITAKLRKRPIVSGFATQDFMARIPHFPL